ncbi:hypothetical protein KQI18_10540 [Clostridioides mangenotii]|uniref:hypothetical protein n=1 Tax=Metaclostridioides mangenotii TaxID=1540 RepID=UPI001C0F953F|nr:hypothetical protein [Clostridioides mangenotii]MBU5308216.1 hypothetical protein [Clostridioides mangenotii]
MKNNNTNNTIAFRKKEDDLTNNIISDKKLISSDSPKVIPFPKNGKRDGIKKKNNAKKCKINYKDSYVNFFSINEYKNNYKKNRFKKSNTNIYVKIFYMVILVLLVSLFILKVSQNTNSFSDIPDFTSALNKITLNKFISNSLDISV